MLILINPASQRFNWAFKNKWLLWNGRIHNTIVIIKLVPWKRKNGGLWRDWETWEWKRKTQCYKKVQGALSLSFYFSLPSQCSLLTGEITKQLLLDKQTL